MIGQLLTVAPPALDQNGNPYSGAKWYFYKSGTMTPLAVYADAALTVSLGSVVTADSAGRFVPIYLDLKNAYRSILQSADGSATLSDIDPVNTDGLGDIIQYLEEIIEAALQAALAALPQFGTAGSEVAAAISTYEARIAMGLREVRRGGVTAGESFVVNSDDIMPALHFCQLAAPGEVYFDVAALRYYEPYLFVNGSAFGGNMILDCGADMHFRAAHINPSLSNQHRHIVRASEWCILVKYGGNRIQIIGPGEQGYWATSGNTLWRYWPNGTAEVIHTRPAASTIPGETEGAGNNLPTFMDLTNAKILSCTPGQQSGAPTAQMAPWVSKKGTADGLANNYTFNIYNPNSSEWGRDVVTHFVNVEIP